MAQDQTPGLLSRPNQETKFTLSGYHRAQSQPSSQQPYQYSYPPPNHAYAGGASNYPPLPPIDYPDRRGPVPINTAANPPGKRIASQTHPSESPAKKKQSKWSAEEDASIIELRGNGMKWEDISKNLPGRSAISCRLRFQNYLERRSEWDEEKKNKLARLYERFKKDMWEGIAKEMALPWRAAEAMHWQIGEGEMANRANVPVFHLAGNHGSQQMRPSLSESASFSTNEQRSSTESPPIAGDTTMHEGHAHSLEQSSMLRPRRESEASYRRQEDLSPETSRPPPPLRYPSTPAAIDQHQQHPSQQYYSPIQRSGDSSKQ